MAIERLRTVVDYDDFVAHQPHDTPTPELMNGGFIMAARLTRQHMVYAQEIFAAMHAYIREHHLVGAILTEFEVVLDEHTVIIPDIAYVIANSTLGRITDERLYGAPDFVCEIVSPSTRAYDAKEKYLAYLRAGVREYWIVDPYAPSCQHFALYERIEQATRSTKPAFQRIASTLADSRLFPGITIDPALL